MKNFDGHVSSCMIKRLVRGNGGCSNFTIGDVTRKWGSELRSLDDGCMLSDYEGGKDQMCGFCLRKWDEIGGSFHISDTVDKADENVCRFAILVTLMSSRINDERWVQALARTAEFLEALIVLQEMGCLGAGQRKKVLRAALARGTLVAFSYRSLQSATKNFSERLGGGGFGSVFKGTLPDLAMVAVKKLEGLRQGEKQFRAEVSSIGTIQHVNLIRLRGFCPEGNKKLLVYDYMPNGSLNFHLFGTAKCLDWSRRYQIAIETARGLAYLHEKCQECIIHFDIRPENILLDGAFSVKIADFGLAKMFGREFSHVLTTMRGAVGYVAPEWISGLTITPKADVYSYGMMLFEIIPGRRNRKQSVRGPTRFFPTWAMTKMSEGDVECVLDDRSEANADIEEVHRACRVAGWCIQDNEKDDPWDRLSKILEGVLESFYLTLRRGGGEYSEELLPNIAKWGWGATNLAEVTLLSKVQSPNTALRTKRAAT
ncbi:hypothetical protein ACLOJK_020599 [Asimina triloba]